MRFFRRLVFASLAALVTLLPAPAAFAQTTYTTNITLAKVYLNGALVPYGQLCAIGSDQYSNPITYSENTWGVISRNSAFCANVVAGAVSGGMANR